MNSEINGCLLINKPEGITSCTVVRKIKKLLNQKSVGHLGTLDPFASGLLPILIGGATKLSDYLHLETKSYEFTIKFGTETDTLDTTGKVIKEKEIPSNFALDLSDNIFKFIGEIWQIPPSYSSLKMNGVALHKHMRKTGFLPENIATKKRLIEIKNLQIKSIDIENDNYFATLFVHCSKGTYIRSLARDLAETVGTVGHCYKLKRTIIGNFTIDNSINFNDLNDLSYDDILKKIITPENLLLNIHVLNLPIQYKKILSSGNKIFYDHEIFSTLANHSLIFAKVEEVLFIAEIDSELKAILPRKKIT